ncbi:PAS domain S-box protein [Mesorhizobium sp. J428]|uniref:hybrid sensor histidine kinase/response regulator n=1 Tax=Mesorhizobium sp. J428 TaxID=2898440 RepID=UPI002151C202|nr:PAS domain S-box protein [Mesorhizobium sp. J428]MCR5858386.1 PAS domain S-box protein [Mesorhizobium sp. J428]
MTIPAGDAADTTTRQLNTHEEHARVYAAVIESALDSVVVVDEKGVVVSINPAAEATFGYSKAEAVGREISHLIVPDHLKAAHDNGMARYRATNTPHVLGRRVEMDARRKDGSIIPVELAITEVNLASGRLFTANLRDLSASRAAAAEIERQRDALHQSEKLSAIGSLLAGIAHELNNPLSIVVGQSGILREELQAGGPRPSSADRAARIETAAQRCARIIRTFLAIARQRKPEKRAIEIAPLVEGSIELVLYGIRSNGVVLDRDIESGLPPVFADPDQVQNVIVNLLVNATQALEQMGGERRVLVTARRDGDMLSVVVADNGPGIRAENRERIFDAFFTTKPEGAGTGIGLPISRNLALAQGGSLTLLESAAGAHFELRLPVDASASTGATPDEARPAAAPMPPRLRAIIVDDEAEIAELVAEILERAGIDCETASNGSEARARIEAAGDGFDIVVSDLRMPEMDGSALFEWLRDNRPALAESMLFMTGDSLGPNAGRFLATSGRPVMEKPFVPDDLLRHLSALLAEQALKRMRNG